ncbi:helix-turn-helix domain-containing protein [Zhihengliuella halotolerans]|uniref:helix-turn-helix domain-containing protein n=1 Tax=Zhihengliuella halotolerans TaxID=370736 RepID=UPI0011AF5BA6|nr:helix-turn-helix domain-containing protein [Zhihengliuella halotolerans]
MMARDIEYLLRLGLSIEEIARRAGRTPTAIRNELAAYRQKQKEEGTHASAG